MADHNALQPRDAADFERPLGASPEGAHTSGGFGIYKYGAGYWVRMLTALALMVITLAAGAWAWNQAQAISLPLKGHTLAPASGGNAPEGLTTGQTAELLTITADNQLVSIGTAPIVSVSSRGIELGRAVLKGTYAMGETRSLRVGEAGKPIEIARVAGVPAIEPVYVQAGLAGLVVLIGLALIWRFVGTKPKSVEFLIATDEEMRKVNWSTRKIIIDSTKVVILATFLIAGAIFILDFVFRLSILGPIVGKGA